MYVWTADETTVGMGVADHSYTHRVPAIQTIAHQPTPTTIYLVELVLELDPVQAQRVEEALQHVHAQNDREGHAGCRVVVVLFDWGRGRW